MLRFAWLALVAGIVLPVAARAQAVPANPQGFGFCSVTDTSSAQAKIWASPVFPLEYPGDDPGGFQRGIAVAGEFLTHVRTLGGSGDKSCIVVDTQGEAAVFREEQRAIWDKRVYFIKIGDWRDVAWTPAPWKPSPAASAASVTRYFLCQATQTDIPDRSDRSRSVASGVFAMPVPGDNALAAGYEQAKAYAAEFQSVVQAHGLPVQGDCMSHDTRDEAQYAYQQMLRLLKGFNQKYTEVAWTPTGRTPAVAATPAAPVPQQAVEATTPPTLDATPQPSTPAPATAPAEQALYCTGFVMRPKPALMVRAPVRKEAEPAYTPATATATLSTLVSAVQQAHPGEWRDLSQIGCYDNDGVIAGEKLCVVSNFKRFGGGVQMGGLFCNASREMIDQRWEQLVKADGGHAQIFPWPESP